MPIPTFDIELLRPGVMQAEIVGAAIEGGRALSGITGSIDMTGGGLVSVKYDRIMLATPDEHRYWNKLAAYLRGGINKIYVPILNDVTYPYPTDLYANKPPMSGPYWIGSPFFGDDMTRYEWFSASIAADVSLNAGTIGIRVRDLRSDTLHRSLNPALLQGGEWFGIDHGGTKNRRAYRISEVDGVSGTEDNQIFTVGVSPPLRAATLADTSIEFYRPPCTMGLTPDDNMPWIPNAGWFGEHSLNLMEKF